MKVVAIILVLMITYAWAEIYYRVSQAPLTIPFNYQVKLSSGQWVDVKSTLHNPASDFQIGRIYIFCAAYLFCLFLFLFGDNLIKYGWFVDRYRRRKPKLKPTARGFAVLSVKPTPANIIPPRPIRPGEARKSTIR